MIICRWSVSGDQVEIANAGHHAPLWVTTSGKIDAYPDRVGVALGIDKSWDGQIVCRKTDEDVAMLLSSDGITEARDSADNEYGLARVAQSFAELHTRSADEITAGLVNDARKFCSPGHPTDDLTLLVVKRK